MSGKNQTVVAQNTVILLFVTVPELHLNAKQKTKNVYLFILNLSI